MFEIPLLGKFLSSTTDSNHHLGDVADQLHQKVTVTILILCTLFLGGKQQFGQPIQCMLPAHLDRSSWTSYGQYYCFVESTYRLAYNKTMPSASARAELHSKADVEINYYQWVPFFLAIQALCFYIPGWIWTTLQAQRVLDMKAVVGEAVSIKKEFKTENRMKKLKNIVGYVASALRLKMTMREKKKYTFLLDGLNGISTAVYLTSKLLNTANDLVQLYIIGVFIGVDSFSWALSPLAVGKRHLEMSFVSPYFPRITFCDMERQTLGGVEMNTLQCVLMLNFINEKIFFMLWYYISLLFVISLANFVITFLQCTQARCREISVKFYLQFLGLDGVLLLRFICDHAGAIIARDITTGLWHSFCGSYRDSNPYLMTRESAADIKEAKTGASYPLSSHSTTYF